MADKMVTQSNLSPLVLLEQPNPFSTRCTNSQQKLNLLDYNDVCYVRFVMLSFILHRYLSVLSELCLRVLWCMMVFIGNF